MGTEIYKPKNLHNFSMYIGGHWYSLTAKKGTYDDNDPIGCLDVTICSNLIFDKLLDIKDLRTSEVSASSRRELTRVRWQQLSLCIPFP